MADVVTLLANNLMRAVVRTGCLRAASNDADVGVRVMREELKAFLTDAKYADERALALEGRDGLAFASLTAECVRRILAERAA